jgi:proteasome lid subunit RPN8/RPN11
MSSMEPIPAVSGSATEIDDQARDIRRDMVSLRWYSRKKPIVVKLPPRDELNLSLGRRGRLSDGWKLKLHEQLTTCPECRKRASAIDRVFIGPAPPEVTELASWLSEIIYNHFATHASASHRHSSEESVGGTLIKVSTPEEPTGARIKVLSARDEAADTRATPSPRGRIKIKETPVVTIARSPDAERSPEPGGRRAEEAAGVDRAIGYEVGATAVVVLLPARICAALVHHCRASLNHGKEVGGVIIGRKEEERRSGRTEIFVRATDLIPFRAADSSGSRLVLTPDSWAHVSNVESVEGYEAEGKMRLGWYHTHPNQGIFFSRHDCDFHSVFSNAFQFALVVDPRNMQAGFFYWQNHGRRALGEPRKFSLIPDSEPDPTPPIVVNDEKPTPPRARPAARRLIFFTVLTVAAVIGIAGFPPFYLLTPIDIILLSLIASLGLGLWNIQWFHPTYPLELAVLTQAQQWINNATTPRDKPAPPGSRRGLLTVWLFAIPIALVVAGIIVWPRVKNSKMLNPMPGVSEQPDIASVAGNKGSAVTNETREIVLSSISPTQITLLANNASLAVDYRLVNKTWACDPRDEREFFERLFRWELTEEVSQTYIEDLQAKLGSGDSRQYDGKWGPNTRRLLLEKLKSMAKSKGTFDLLLKDNKPVTVRVTELSGSGSSKAQPQPPKQQLNKRPAAPEATKAQPTTEKNPSDKAPEPSPQPSRRGFLQK